MSISTTSGSSRRARSTASTPSPASPTMSRSASAPSTIRNPVRSSGWSSASSTRIGRRTAGHARFRLGRRRTQLPSGSSRTPGSRRPAGARCAACRRTARPARACRPGRARRAAVPSGARPAAGVEHLDGQPVPAERRAAPRRVAVPGVLERVGQRLLHDPVDRQRHARVERGRLAVAREARPAGRPRAPARPAPSSAGQAGLRGQRRPSGSGVACAARRAAGASRAASCGWSPRSWPAPRRRRPGRGAAPAGRRWPAPPSR